MNIHLRRTLILLICLLSVCAYGQRRRRVAPKPIVNVDSLLLQYRFEEATEAIQEQIAQNERKNLPTDELEYKAEKARIGANMLMATAKVTVIDSMVVNKDDILAHLKIDKSCGQLNYWKNLFQMNKNIGQGVLTTTTYVNDFQDRIYYSYPDATGHLKLFNRFMLNGKWSDPIALEGIGDSITDDAYPYVLSDGLTLYFASYSEEGLGGYDIYVTRYNTDTKRYMKAENMGMPFNSPANDYLMVIDEASQLGWFVSDRNQPEGKVCIYMFIPEDSRSVLPYDADNAGHIRQMAMLHHIGATQEDRGAVADARQRYKALLAGGSETKAQKGDFRFVLYDKMVYTSLADFKSSKAKQLASNWKDLKAKQQNTLTELQKSRRGVAENPALKGTVLQLEKTLSQLDDTIKDLEQNIRYEEQAKLGINK